MAKYIFSGGQIKVELGVFSPLKKGRKKSIEMGVLLVTATVANQSEIEPRKKESK